MRNMDRIKNITLTPFIISLFFLTIYLFFPSTNSSIDSWAYALYIKQAKELFLSHHLLNGAMGYLWVKLVGFFLNVDVLKLMLILNALFASAILYLLGLILKNLGIETKKAAVWVAFVGASWAIMRYATENEVYIFPIFFSLLGSYFYIKSLKEQNFRIIVLSGFFAALACLFHQIMFFWWLALLIGFAFRKNVKTFIWYAIPALIVPIIYLLVLVFYYKQTGTLNSFMHFVFNDYYSGAAGISTGLSSFLLLIVGVVRSFIQIHGYIINIGHFSLLFYLGLLLALLLFIFSLIKIKTVQWKWINVKSHIVWVHLLTILLQLFFALLSSGNAEFMVMIPLLLSIVLSQVLKDEIKFIGLITAAMFVWNISFGLIPLNFYNLDNNRTIAAQVIKDQKESTPPLYILFNRPRVENEVEYHLGYCPKNLVTGIQYEDIKEVKEKIDEALFRGVLVYTDCINRPKTLSRETLTITNTFEEKFSEYTFSKADSINTLTGKYYLYSITKK